MSTFRVGQMVVAVRAQGGAKSIGDPIWDNIHKLHRPKLQFGRIYTIRDIDTRSLVAPTIRLEEIICPSFMTIRGSYELGYHPDNFRPVKDTSIEIFRQLVANPKDKVRA